MANVLQKDPVIYERERDSFIRDLKHFHETRGGRLRKLPHVNGKDVDLYLLYVLVTGKGGWLKVNQRNDWMTILEHFPTLNICVNGEVAIKQIYSRYLDKYEKVNFLGETADRASEDDEDGRHKRWTTSKTSHFTTVSYNSLQHNIASENTRASGVISNTNQCGPTTDYDKLCMSLISPLPNEQDFAINVCGLLCGGTTDNDADVSDISVVESKFGADFKLYEHPRLVNYLLAHAAVFDHPALRMLMEECYKEVRGHSMKYFWSDILVDGELSVLMDEKKFVKQRLKREKLKRRLKGHGHRSRATYDASSSDESDQNDDRLQSNSCFIDDRIHLKIEPDDAELFCLSRGMGTEDWFGQRVLQIATILRNATFMDENVPTLACNYTFLRFVLLCCGSRWNCIHQLGFDMLTNIAQAVTLDDTIMEYVLRIISTGLESQDRAVVLACIETLNKFGQKDENEDIILRSVDQNVYKKICTFLTLKDIMLLIQTLECLYSLTLLGERSCNAVAHVRGVIHTLVSLVTVEAQSYGPSACILMRVVETMMSNDNEEPESVPAGITMSPLVSIASQTGSIFSNNSNTITITTATPVNSSLGNASSMPNTHIVNINTPITNTINAGTTLTVVPSSQSINNSCIPNNNAPSPIVPTSSIIPSTPSSMTTVLTTACSSSTTITMSSGAIQNKLSAPQKTNIPTLTTTSASAFSTNLAVATCSNQSSNHTAAIMANQQENENFAKCWLRALFEFHANPGRGIEQNEIYKQYLNVCTRGGRKGVIAPTHFPQCVRSVFGNSVGPRQVVGSKVGSENTVSKIYVYEGLQVRKNPLPFALSNSNSSVQSSAPNNPSSPILKAQLSTPSSNVPIKKEPKSKVSSSHPHLSNVLLGTSNVNSSVTSSVIHKNTKMLHSTITSSSVSVVTCSPSVITATSLATASTALSLSQNTSVPSVTTSTSLSSSASSSSSSQDSYGMINIDTNTNGANSNNNNNTSLIKSLLASKVGDILGTNASSNLIKNDNCLITSLQPSHQQVVITKTPTFSSAQSVIALNPFFINDGRFQLIQVTQRQQHQQQGTPIQPSQQNNQQNTLPQSQLQQLIQQPIASTLQIQQPTLQISSQKQQNESDTNKLVIQQQQQPQQIIQVIHHSSSQQQQSQSQLPVTFRNSQPVIVHHQSQQPHSPMKTLSTVSVISSADADKLILNQQQLSSTAIVSQKKVDSSSKQYISLTEQIRQLLQNQKSNSQLSQLISQPVTSKSIQIQQPQQQFQIQSVQQLKQNQNLQQVQVVQQVKQTNQQQSLQQLSSTRQVQNNTVQQVQSPKQPEQAKTVSVITSSAAVQAGCALKPFLSRINGLRNLQNMNIIIADRTEDNEIRIIANNKPSSVSSSITNTVDDNKKLILANNTLKLPVSTASVGTTIDNNLLSSDTVTLPPAAAKIATGMETNICEPSVSHSLPVINLRDSENNIVGTDGNPPVVFNDYLINGLSGNIKADVISETMLNNPLPNNMLTEESLLNTIMMEDALASNLIGEDPLLNNINVDNMDFSLPGIIKLENINSGNNGCNTLNTTVTTTASSMIDIKPEIKQNISSFVLVSNNSKNGGNNEYLSIKNTLTEKKLPTDLNFTDVCIKTENDAKITDTGNNCPSSSSSSSSSNNVIVNTTIGTTTNTTTITTNMAKTVIAGKSLMLAELLEKSADRKDPPILNGALRIGEKGLELMTFTSTGNSINPTTGTTVGTSAMFVKDNVMKPPTTNTVNTIAQEKGVICSGKRITQTYSRFNKGKSVDVIRKAGGNNNNNNKRQTQFSSNNSNEKVIIGVKRTNDQEVQCDEMSKKPHLNGDSNLSSSNDDDTMDDSNVKASSSAANLYAALAADVLGDIDGIEDEESPAATQASQIQQTPQTTSQQTQSSLSVQTQLSVPTNTIQQQQQLQPLQTQHIQPQQIQQAIQPQQIQIQQTAQQMQQTQQIHQQQQTVLVEPTQQLYLSTAAGPGNTSRQILALAPGSTFSSLAGQQLIVSPQTAIIQGQPQTVLVTQTPQQHGAPTKTIIILSPNAPSLSLPTASAAQAQKVIVRQAASPPIIASTAPQSLVTTSSLITNAVKQTYQSKGTVTTPVAHIQGSIPFSRILTQPTTNSVVMSQSGQFIQTEIPHQVVANSQAVGVITRIGNQSQISSGLMVPFSSSQIVVNSPSTNIGGSIIVSNPNINIQNSNTPYSQQNANIITQNNNIIAQNANIITPNSNIIAQNPNIASQNSCIVTQTSTVIAQNVSVVTQNPNMIGQNVSTLGQNTITAVTQPAAVVTQNPTVITSQNINVGPPNSNNIVTQTPATVIHNTGTVIQSTNIARSVAGQLISSNTANNNNNSSNNRSSSPANVGRIRQQSPVAIQTTQSPSVTTSGVITATPSHTPSTHPFSTTICQTVTTNTITITKHAGNASSNPQTRQGKGGKNTASHSTRPSIHRIHSDGHGQFLCEWRSCMRSFKTANEVYLHACSAHCPSGSQEIQCLWERCDAMKRKRFSLMTHLYDRHCNPEILRVMSLRRRQISQSGRSDIPPPAPPPPHPGYAPNAAYQAIRRHALEFVNPRELQDENEGPVTKSIRLTSSLILRNLVIYSTTGRRCVSAYEPQLASVALSNVESSCTISQLLYDLNNHGR